LILFGNSIVQGIESRVHLTSNRIVALAENTPAIEGHFCARQAWRRKPAEPSRVLA